MSSSAVTEIQHHETDIFMDKHVAGGLIIEF